MHDTYFTFFFNRERARERAEAVLSVKREKDPMLSEEPLQGDARQHVCKPDGPFHQGLGHNASRKKTECEDGRPAVMMGAEAIELDAGPEQYCPIKECPRWG